MVGLDIDSRRNCQKTIIPTVKFRKRIRRPPKRTASRAQNKSTDEEADAGEVDNADGRSANEHVRRGGRNDSDVIHYQ